MPGARACPIFPSLERLEQTVKNLPVAANSAAMISAIGADDSVHPDFGSYLGYGIPYTVVSGKSTPKVKVSFEYADESDRVGYPIPEHPNQESSGDGHILLVDKDACRLYELFDASGSGDSWKAGSGAVWNLRSNHLRPNGWTSADAAGLPILPGLVRYDEVAAGAIRHALRFTAEHTATRPHLPRPPRRRQLRRIPASDGAARAAQGLGRHLGLWQAGPRRGQALKTYGMILADNGSNWFISGASDHKYRDDDLRASEDLKGSDFEVVDTSGLRNG